MGAIVGGGGEALVTSPAAGTGAGIVVPAAGVATAGVGALVTAHGTAVGGNTLHNIFSKGRSQGPTVDPNTGQPVGRFIGDSKGNVMIEPKGGKTVPAGKNGVDTHTTYPNGSNYQRLNPQGHANNPKPHGHGHLQGKGPGKKGQGDSIDNRGKQVPFNSKDAHWDIN